MLLSQTSLMSNEKKSKMDELRCTMLENEVEDLKKRNKELEEQITRIQNVMSNEEKGKNPIVDLTGDEFEEDECMKLKIEIKVLECEKAKAEADVCFWKEKAKELESMLNMNMNTMNDDVISTPICVIERLETGAKQENRVKSRKRLQFEEVGCSNTKLAPSTPHFAPPPSSGIIDISDEDDMLGFTTPKRKRCSNIITSDDEDNKNDFKRNPSSNVVTSDGETSDDDNAPICTLINKEGSSRRPLKRLRKSDDITIDLLKTGNSSSEDEEDDDESLDRFIVDSSESESESESESGSGSGSGGRDSCDDSEDGSDGYKETLDKIRRKKELKTKWELEGDMLADFGKDPELCMRAVCALYRQQTEDEKAGLATIYLNGRGFSQFDAFRGSDVAEFLTDGDPNGDLNKTVEELERYDAKGVELCMRLAAKYSKQLFQIYQSKEDPYFLP
ncbi:hypothetical protein LXL04_035188 [Taraxacum kok-saghyz]